MFFKNNYVTVDMDSFPLIYIKFSDTYPTDVEFDDFLIALATSYSNNKERITFYDLTEFKPLSVTNQMKFVNYLNENKTQTEKYLKGVAIVTDTQENKDTIEFIIKNTKTIFDIKVFISKELAFGYIKDVLKQISQND